MLTQREVVGYLLDNGFLSKESVVDGDMDVHDASRRNCNFKVIKKGGPSFLIKQGTSPDAVATIAHEAEVYRAFQSGEPAGQLSRYLPQFFGYDAEQKTLVLEYVQESETLQSYYARSGRFSVQRAAEIGSALAAFHRVTGETREEIGSKSPLGKEPPWVLSLDCPQLEVIRNISSANLQLIKIIQRFPEFCASLEELRDGWRTDTLIHFDIKWDNCLIHPIDGSKRRNGLKFVDWELASIGDACWDVGSIFNDYLSLWLLSIPVTGETPPERFPALARFPLSRMQPAIGSFWQSYVNEMALTNSSDSLLRSIKYAAARLVQTSYEQMQNSMQLSGNVVCFLQVALNIFRRPHEATAHLLGIPC